MRAGALKIQKNEEFGVPPEVAVGNMALQKASQEEGAPGGTSPFSGEVGYGNP